MAEQKPILADPASSDGSEDSWILLDEMDEAMNEIDGVLNHTSTEHDESTDEHLVLSTSEVDECKYQNL